MLKTTLLDGMTPAEFDTQITTNLLMEVAPVDEVRGEAMIIGVRNADGDIYRLIAATKMNSYMNACEELFDLDLVDELQDTEEPQEGCDAIFGDA